MNFCHNIRSNYIITKLVKCQYFLATFKTFEGNELKKRWDGERRCGAKSSLKLCLLWDFAWLAFLFQLFFQKFRPYLTLLIDYIAIHMTTRNSFRFVVETCSLCDLIMSQSNLRCFAVILFYIQLISEENVLDFKIFIIFFFSLSILSLHLLLSAPLISILAKPSDLSQHHDLLFRTWLLDIGELVSLCVWNSN